VRAASRSAIFEIGMFEPVFITHGGKRILRADYSGVDRRDLLEAFGATGRVVTAEPPRSVRVLSILRADLNADAVAALKRLSASNAPHVLAVAVVGTSFWNMAVVNIQAQGRTDIRLFEGEQEALDWLASR